MSVELQHNNWQHFGKVVRKHEHSCYSIEYNYTNKTAVWEGLEKRLGLGLAMSRSLSRLEPKNQRSRSRSRLGQKTKCLGLVSVSEPKVSFTTLPIWIHGFTIECVRLEPWICWFGWWSGFCQTTSPITVRTLLLSMRSEYRLALRPPHWQIILIFVA